jgi:hypothetical protein
MDPNDGAGPLLTRAARRRARVRRTAVLRSRAASAAVLGALRDTSAGIGFMASTLAGQPLSSSVLRADATPFASNFALDAQQNVSWDSDDFIFYLGAYDVSFGVSAALRPKHPAPVQVAETLPPVPLGSFCTTIECCDVALDSTNLCGWTKELCSNVAITTPDADDFTTASADCAAPAAGSSGDCVAPAAGFFSDGFALSDDDDDAAVVVVTRAPVEAATSTTSSCCDVVSAATDIRGCTKELCSYKADYPFAVTVCESVGLALANAPAVALTAAPAVDALFFWDIIVDEVFAELDVSALASEALVAIQTLAPAVTCCLAESPAPASDLPDDECALCLARFIAGPSQAWLLENWWCYASSPLPVHLCNTCSLLHPWGPYAISVYPLACGMSMRLDPSVPLRPSRKSRILFPDVSVEKDLHAAPAVASRMAVASTSSVIPADNCRLQFLSDRDFSAVACTRRSTASHFGSTSSRSAARLFCSTATDAFDEHSCTGESEGTSADKSEAEPFVSNALLFDAAESSDKAALDLMLSLGTDCLVQIHSLTSLAGAPLNGLFAHVISHAAGRFQVRLLDSDGLPLSGLDGCRSLRSFNLRPGHLEHHSEE